MHLDTVTLMIVGSLTAAVSGLWLAWAWTQKRDVPSLAWWAAANLSYAVGIAGLAVGLTQNRPAVLLGGLLLTILAPALVWAGARVFGGRRVPLALLFAGVIALLATTAATFHDGPSSAGAGVSFAGWIAYLLAAVRELWRGRDEELPARRPLMLLLLIHAAVYAGGLYDVVAGNFLDNGVPPLGSWFGLVYFEGLFYAMGTAVFMSLLGSERAERRYRTAASIDMLTGVANRGAFFDRAERMLERCAREGLPLSLIMFDLDRFKSINDNHGHQLGDRVLIAFADTVRGALRPNDLFGRHGGEEFAVVLAGETLDTAYAIAERVRRAFAEVCRDLDGVSLGATVSAGVAAASAGATLEKLMAAADGALYRAKNQGRNCVRRADGPPGNGDGAKVIRVA